MGIYHNDYNKKKDPVMWELHEIRHELAEEFKAKSVDEINKEARKLFNKWKQEYTESKSKKAV